MNQEKLQRIARALANTRENELSCDECFEQLDRFAEMMLNGRPAAETIPLVQHHLNLCIDCREEFDALMKALRSG